MRNFLAHLGKVHYRVLEASGDELTHGKWRRHLLEILFSDALSRQRGISAGTWRMCDMKY
jgi:hypothetical protein